MDEQTAKTETAPRLPLPGLPARLRNLHLELQPGQLTLLEQYGGWLTAANEKVNLTAIKEPADIETKHMADSLSLLAFVDQWATAAGKDPLKALKLVDVGTGGGLPGIPLAIARPGWQVTLVDSVRKKAKLVEEGVQALGLTEQVRMINDRAENLGMHPAFRERFDVAVARAVASLIVLAEWLLPLVRVGGCVLCPRGDKEGAQLDADIQMIPKHFPGTLVQMFDARVPGLPGRQVAVLLKTQKCPHRFPRPVGQAIAKPLTWS